MWTAIGGLAVLLGLSVYVTRVREQYARRRAEAEAGEGESADARVAKAWDAFGLEEDPDAARAAVDAVLREAAVDALREKGSVVALAVMAARTGRTDVLDALAARAAMLDGGCGETAALGVLAAAYAGDEARARELLARSRAVMSGCASCGASADSKVLMQEVEIALSALAEGALGEGTLGEGAAGEGAEAGE